MEHVLFVCTANICRSPMAERILTSRLHAHDPDVTVSSAGIRAQAGAEMPSAATAALQRRGIEPAEHVSRALDTDLLHRSTLVLTMTRAQSREAAVMAPEALPRIYTLREIVRLGARQGPRRAGEVLAGWATRLHAGRDPHEMLGASELDDIIDPYGRQDPAYEKTAEELERLLARFEHLAWGST